MPFPSRYRIAIGTYFLAALNDKYLLTAGITIVEKRGESHFSAAQASIAIVTGNVYANILRCLGRIHFYDFYFE